MFNKGSQKIKGDRNIQAARDIVFGASERQEEKDIGIVNDILNYVFDNKISPVDSTKKREKDELEELSKKIPLNCKKGEDEERLEEMFYNLWASIKLVEKYLGDVEDKEKVLRLKELVQAEYKKLKDNGNNIIRIFEELPLMFLQVGQKSNPDYRGGAKAIVLYFFELCDIGQKTEKEKEKQKTLFD